MRTVLVAAAIAASLAGCGGGGGEAAPESKPPVAERSRLEARLARTSVGICDGRCATYHARSATCTGVGTALGGRTFYPCRVRYEREQGMTPSPDELCAALDPKRGYVARPRGDC